jgi:transposase
MSPKNKYSIIDFRIKFSDDNKCLEYIFITRYSRKCACGGTYKRIKSRRQFQCSSCRKQIAPTAGTILHKSSLPLMLWFYGIWVYSLSNGNISAAEMERQLGVTYKCAWRMKKNIAKGLIRTRKKDIGNFNNSLNSLILFDRNNY